MTFECDSVMALKTLSFKCIFLLICCLFSLAAQHLPLWPCTSVLPADLAEKSHMRRLFFYCLLENSTRLWKVKTPNALSHNNSVVLSFRLLLENNDYLHPWQKNKRKRDGSVQQTLRAGGRRCEVCVWVCAVEGALCPVLCSSSQEKNI